MGNASVCVNSEFLGDEVGRKGVDVLIDTLEGGRELPQEWSDRDDDDEDQEKVTPDEPGEGGTGWVEGVSATPRLLLGWTGCLCSAHAIVSLVALWIAAARRARPSPRLV